MRSTLALALSALAINGAAAAPLNGKRDVVWHTVTRYVTEVVDVYTTVWVPPPGGSAPEPTGIQKLQQAPPAKPSPAPQPAAPKPAVQPAAAPQNDKAAPSPAPSPKPQVQQAPAPAPVPVPAPAPQPAPQPAPKPQPQPAPAPAPAPKPAQPNAGGQSSGGGSPKVFSSFSNPLPGASAEYDCGGGCEGDMTFFNPSQGVGACGYKDGSSQIWTDEDDVVAISVKMMGTLSSGDTPNPFCGQKIKITNPNNGKTATGLVTDKCFGCPGNQDIDLSPHLYDQLADAADGRIAGVQWSWM